MLHEGTDYEISNLDYYIEKSIELSQNIHNYWHLGSLDVKKKIQKLIFPEGIVIDTTNRTYLTSNVNSFFLAKSQFMRSSEGIKEKLPIKNDEESSLSSGGRIRTSDLWVMSPTSYHCSTPQYILKILFFNLSGYEPNECRKSASSACFDFRASSKNKQIKDLRFSGLPHAPPRIIEGQM